MSNYPEGVTAGSPIFDTTDTEDRWCSTCEKDTEHVVTKHPLVTLFTCTVCGSDGDEEVEPDPDEAHDKMKEDW